MKYPVEQSRLLPHDYTGKLPDYNQTVIAHTQNGQAIPAWWDGSDFRPIGKTGIVFNVIAWEGGG